MIYLFIYLFIIYLFIYLYILSQGYPKIDVLLDRIHGHFGYDVNELKIPFSRLIEFD